MKNPGHANVNAKHPPKATNIAHETIYQARVRQEAERGNVYRHAQPSQQARNQLLATGQDSHIAAHGNQLDADNAPMNPALAILLLYGTLFLMIGAQMGLFLWKKRHQKSYDLVTLIGLWIMPALFCVQLKFYRFLLIWFLYTCITAYLLRQCTAPKMDSSTPRRVYSWFLGVYRVSKVMGIVGYILLVVEGTGAGVFLRTFLPKDIALDMLWYGLYFGVLGRDCAEVASNRMASSVSRNMNARINDCGICGNPFNDFSHLGEESAIEEKTVQLECKHCFHDLCVRGWTMVGKKDTCPVCLEKVDLRALYADRPWETRNLTWIQMLDAVRYLVVWNPVIFMAVSVLFHLLAPHPHTHPHLAPLDGIHALNSSLPSPLAALAASDLSPPGLDASSPIQHLTNLVQALSPGLSNSPSTA